ncbi:MAG TPA: molybdenum ABC transporter ATP-binding protein [Deltaproteobacteria bacterium]|nr:molybdenum ABC transporter ATP-binding protein [Deltaproteobacteria bacterium]
MAASRAPHRVQRAVMNESELTLHGAAGSFQLDVEAAWSKRVAVLFGPSGAGKTTLLEVIVGLRPQIRGRVRVAGEWLEDSERGLFVPVEARGLGWVPQDPTLLPHLSVGGNLRFGQRRAGREGAALLDRAIEVLELGGLLARRVNELSGGERQRVALARALASGPRAVLLDEPLAALDLALRARVLPFLLRVRDELGLPMLYITHDPNEAMLIGEVALVLAAGRVIALGPPREVLWSQAVLPFAQALGVENVLEARGVGGARVETRRGLRLVVPGDVAAGEQLRLGLRAEEILLAAEPLGRISARNILAVTVVSCEVRGNEALVRLDTGAEPLVARVTAAAAEALALQGGARVYAVIKAQSLRPL